MGISCIVSCEHGYNQVPHRFQSLFWGAESVLESHRGFDIGAKELARHLALQYEAPLYIQEVTRLLIDCNRSLGNPTAFSSYSRLLTKEEKEDVIQKIYTPYRANVHKSILKRLQEGLTVLHLSIHTFTPVFDGHVRTTDIGLLYDPQKPLEKNLCLKWRQILKKQLKGLNIHLNSPYRGWTDGFTTILRKEFGASYLGIEIEVNQRLYVESITTWHQIGSALATSLELLLQNEIPGLST